MEPADEDNGLPVCAEITSADALRDTISAAVSAPEGYSGSPAGA